MTRGRIVDMVRVLALATVLVAFTATARAQAPGEVAPAAPAAAPQVSCSGGSGPIDVMANRWAVGLSVGSLSTAPKDTPDDKTQFGIGELALRFRATPHLELEWYSIRADEVRIGMPLVQNF